MMENITLYEYNGEIKGTKAHIKINLFDDKIKDDREKVENIYKVIQALSNE